MPINTQELMNAIAMIADERNIRVAVGQAAKGSLVCAATSFVGGLLMGPVGLAVGGATGGAIAAYMTSGKFKPLSEVIRNDLTARQREQLFNNIVTAVRDVHPTDVAMLLPLLVADSTIKDQVLATVITFVTNQLQLQIVN